MGALELLQREEQSSLRVGNIDIVHELGVCELGVPQPPVDKAQHVVRGRLAGRYADLRKKRLRPVAPVEWGRQQILVARYEHGQSG